MSTTVKVERQGFEEDNVQQELELSEAKEKDEVNFNQYYTIKRKGSF